MTASQPNRPALHTRREFLRRMLAFTAFAAGFLVLSLGIGMVGYHVFAGLGWIDSLLNAAMILTGMGPVDTLHDDSAKIFASLYAIFGGAVYPAMTAIVLYPLLHRMLTVMHLQKLAEDTGDKT